MEERAISWAAIPRGYACSASGLSFRCRGRGPSRAARPPFVRAVTLALVWQQVESFRLPSAPPRTCRPSDGRWSFLVGGGEGALDVLEVKAQAALGAAEADRAELLGMDVDPFALDAEHPCELRSIQVAHPPVLARWLGGEELGDTLGYRLDVGGIEPQDVALSAEVVLAHCAIRALAMGTYSASRSTPRKRAPSRMAAIPVLPLPAKGSGTSPPGGVRSRTSQRISSMDLTVGWMLATGFALARRWAGAPILTVWVVARVSWSHPASRSRDEALGQ